MHGELEEVKLRVTIFLFHQQSQAHGLWTFPSCLLRSRAFGINGPKKPLGWTILWALPQDEARLPNALDGWVQGRHLRNPFRLLLRRLPRDRSHLPLPDHPKPSGKNDSPLLMCPSLHFCGGLQRAKLRTRLNFQGSALSAESRFNSDGSGGQDALPTKKGAGLVERIQDTGTPDEVPTSPRVWYGESRHFWKPNPSSNN